MKIVLTLLFLALAGAVMFTIQRASSDVSRRDGRETDHSVQSSDRQREGSPRRKAKSDEPGTRPLVELRASWQALLPARGESLFSEIKVATFLKTLNRQETEMLLRDLLSRNANKDAASRVMARWGELDSAGALAFLEEEEIRSDLFLQQLYVGWAKTKAKLAFAHYKKRVGISDEVDSPSKMIRFSFMKASIMNSMARSDPDKALAVLWTASQPHGGHLREMEGFTHAERNGVFRGLPQGQDWGAIAEKFAGRVFPYADLTVYAEQGPGGTLFARWAEEEPNSAIAWFEQKESSGGEFGVPSIPTLVGGWYDDDPQSASTWIEGELASPKRTRIIGILNSQINRQQPDLRWLAWGANLPEEDRRFQILKSAAEGDPFANSAIFPRDRKNYLTFSQIKEILPQYQLNEKNEREVLQVSRQREANE